MVSVSKNVVLVSTMKIYLIYILVTALPYIYHTNLSHGIYLHSFFHNTGDGQVSYEEFYGMVVHPDPGGPDYDPAKDKAEGGPPPPPKVPGDPTARVPENERQKLMQLVRNFLAYFAR